MSKNSHNIEVPLGEDASHSQQGFFAPDVSMVLLTWITFFLLLAVLYKFAWKPILSALKEREESIQESLDSAKHAKEEMAQLKADNEKIIAQAKIERDQLLKEARDILLSRLMTGMIICT